MPSRRHVLHRLSAAAQADQLAITGRLLRITLEQRRAERPQHQKGGQ